MTAHRCWWAYNDRAEEQHRRQKHYQYYNRPIRRKERSNFQHHREPSQFITDYRLNERHYGSLQGLVKSDCKRGVHGHSPDDVGRWRRNWHAVPPQLEDDDDRRLEEMRRYRNICGEDNVPKSESLAMVARNRIGPFLTERLTPLLDSAWESRRESQPNEPKGGTALIVAHANSLRALIGVICNVEDDPRGLALRKLESMKIPTASPLVMRYRRTSEGRFVPVGSVLDGDLQSELPVYPLSYLPLLRREPSLES
ncbi:hypothetical protein ACHAWF_012229 [Thalassiosira exigua]